MKERMHKAVLAYLNDRDDYIVIDEDYHGFIVCEDTDSGDYVFVKQVLSEKEFDDTLEKVDRKELEAVMLAWLTETADYIDPCQLHLDICNLIVFAEDKAMLRHHVNVPIHH